MRHPKTRTGPPVMTEITEILQSSRVQRAVFVLGGIALGYLMERLVVTRLY